MFDSDSLDKCSVFFNVLTKSMLILTRNVWSGMCVNLWKYLVLGIIGLWENIIGKVEIDYIVVMKLIFLRGGSLIYK